jgi:hypothetical protein
MNYSKYVISSEATDKTAAKTKEPIHITLNCALCDTFDVSDNPTILNKFSLPSIRLSKSQYLYDIQSLAWNVARRVNPIMTAKGKLVDNFSVLLSYVDDRGYVYPPFCHCVFVVTQHYLETEVEAKIYGKSELKHTVFRFKKTDFSETVY